MSTPYRYHQPDAPDPLLEDSISGDDLDLQELDPDTTFTYLSRHDQKQRGVGLAERERDDAIAMRNLLKEGQRVPKQRSGGYGKPARRRDEEDEDVHGLLEDNGEALDVHQTPNHGVPLMHSTTSGKRRAKNSERALFRFGSKLRLPSFKSNAPDTSTPRAGDPSDRHAEEHDPTATRHVDVGRPQSSRFPPNSISNAKYTPWSFLPRTLYNEFSFFFNLYFLLVALSQIIPALRIGYLSTYVAPLVFVLVITLGKEAADDIARRRRDAESNAEAYIVLRFDEATDHTLSIPGKWASLDAFVCMGGKKTTKDGREQYRDRLTDIQEEEEDLNGRAEHKTALTGVCEVLKKSKDLKIGDILKMGKDQRVPADVVILKSYMAEASGTVASSPGYRESTVEPALLVDAISTPPIEDTRATQVDSRKSTSMDNNTPAADAAGAGETFIRTDQLDGETDWKLRLASPLSQSLNITEFTRLKIVAGKPDKKVNDFVGAIELMPRLTGDNDRHTSRGKKRALIAERDPSNDHREMSHSGVKSATLTIDNTAWANTVLASACTTLAVVVYTGPQTRQALSTAPSRSKTGLLDYEINNLTKILCALTLALSVILVALEGFENRIGQKWYVAMMRFLILFSTIIPISLRVNLDMGKTVYARLIERDQSIPGAVVRTSTIPEELGRIEYLLSDKTGTLTQNEMELKKVHVGTVSYANEAMDEVATYIRQAFSVVSSLDPNQPSKLFTPSTPYSALSAAAAATRTRREIGSRVRDVVLALALCHNVTPTTEEENGHIITAYQASSPDEIAIVRWTESVGLRLVHRDRHGITLNSSESGRVVVRVRILEMFPFTSEGKRMGIIVQFYQGSEITQQISEEAGEIWFYQKGADTVMTSIVAANDWLDEETANMAREGLRTLVVGRKRLSISHYREFSATYKQASLALQDRDFGMAKVVKDYLERDLELLGVTGVEDKLQQDIKPSLELLRNAGIKIWMLTGDKVETARCVAVSAKLVARGQYIYTIANLKRKDLAQDSLDFLRSKTDACLLIDGDSLSLMLTHFRDSFISLTVLLPVVVACRCSPTQKADIAILIRQYTKKRVCCIGDGGNDVSMIQAADVGVGIVGKEGRQASLAADFSITQFCHLTKLLVWHGRNSYKRSAKLAQFIIHRGLIISICQTMYSIATKFEPHALYRDWLLVGYATVYTMAPVFSLVLDKDVDEELANLYPELYRELTIGQSLSYRTFFIWVLVSTYQGAFIQGLSQILVAVEGPRMVSVSFTVLVLNELIMVAFEVTTWHPVMIFSLIGTALVYFGSVPFLGGYFDLAESFAQDPETTEL
ncbi:MAG: putative aminophospholipid-translocase [Pleopsidium flavum]|nr:MAG: putative aminophospholipid-translocase [Pleopsidium flavum]